MKRFIQLYTLFTVVQETIPGLLRQKFIFKNYSSGNTLRSFLNGLEEYFSDNARRDAEICASFHVSESTEAQTTRSLPPPMSSSRPELTKTQIRKRREARYMTRGILPKIPKKGLKKIQMLDRDREYVSLLRMEQQKTFSRKSLLSLPLFFLRIKTKIKRMK